MHAIVRPGPYVCAEWHNGGLPTWLTADPDDGAAQLRAALPRGGHRLPRARERDRRAAADRSGRLGHPGADRERVRRVRLRQGVPRRARPSSTRDAGITVPLTQVDQPIPHMLENGGARGPAQDRLVRLPHPPSASRRCASTSPPARSCAWSSGAAGSTTGARSTTRRTAPTARADLDALLAAGASVNIYMVHGGTNFGLTSGANDTGRYLPMVTSYDYDSPISESGDPTEKFCAFRDVHRALRAGARTSARGLPHAPVFEVALEGVGAAGVVATEGCGPGASDAAADHGRARPRRRASRCSATWRPRRTPTVLESTRCATTPGCTSTTRRSGCCSAPSRDADDPRRPRAPPPRRRDRARQLRHEDRRAQGPHRPACGWTARSWATWQVPAARAWTSRLVRLDGRRPVCSRRFRRLAPGRLSGPAFVRGAALRRACGRRPVPQHRGLGQGPGAGSERVQPRPATGSRGPADHALRARGRSCGRAENDLVHPLRCTAPRGSARALRGPCLDLGHTDF